MASLSLDDDAGSGHLQVRCLPCGESVSRRTGGDVDVGVTVLLFLHDHDHVRRHDVTPARVPAGAAGRDVLARASAACEHSRELLRCSELAYANSRLELALSDVRLCPELDLPSDSPNC